MTRRDKRGDKRPVVAKYHAFKDEVRLRKVTIPDAGAWIVFNIPMPKSWKPKKRAEMDGTPHQQTPDVDNCLKALLDSVFENDAHIWDIRATKFWAVTGSIEVRT
jgi:Holliday junction resolvase RusA-like endonuclease